MKLQFSRKYPFLLAVVAPLLALHLYQPEVSNFWLETFFNWMHVAVFAVVTIGLFFSFDEQLVATRRTMLTIVFALSLACTSELIQIPTARNASWPDLGSDVMGIAIGLLVIPAITTNFLTPIRSRLAALVLLLLSASSVIQVTTLYVERNRAFPVIYDENWPQQNEFISHRNRAIDFRNVVPDWRSYTMLFIDIEVSGELPLVLTVRVHDTEHRRGSQPHSDRYNRRFDLQPGQANLLIPLEEVASGPTTRRLDLSKIDGLVLFSKQTADKRPFTLREISLK